MLFICLHFYISFCSSSSGSLDIFCLLHVLHKLGRVWISPNSGFSKILEPEDGYIISCRTPLWVFHVPKCAMHDWMILNIQISWTMRSGWMTLTTHNGPAAYFLSLLNPYYPSTLSSNQKSGFFINDIF